MFKLKKSSAEKVVDLTVFAEKLLKFRQLRSSYFPAEAIASGGWDLLLHLYSQPVDGPVVTLSSAASALDLPSSDLVSASERICHYGMAVQGDSTGAWQDITLSLTAQGREGMARYLRHFAEPREPELS